MHRTIVSHMVEPSLLAWCISLDTVLFDGNVFKHPSAHPQYHWKNIAQILCSKVQLGKKRWKRKRRKANSKPCISSSSGAADSKLLVKSIGWLHHSAWVVTRHHYGTEERPLDIFRGLSPQQTHHIL